MWWSRDLEDHERLLEGVEVAAERERGEQADGGVVVGVAAVLEGGVRGVAGIEQELPGAIKKRSMGRVAGSHGAHRRGADDRHRVGPRRLRAARALGASSFVQVDERAEALAIG